MLTPILAFTIVFSALAFLTLAGLRLAKRLCSGLERPTAAHESDVALGVACVARRHRGPVTALLALVLFESLLALASPWPLKVVVDDAIGGGRLPSSLSFLAGLGRGGLAVAMGALGVGLVTALAVVGYAATLLSAAVSESVGVRLRSGMMSRLLHLPVDYHDRSRSGDLASRLTTDVGRVQTAMLAKAEVLAPQLIAVVGMTVLMAWLSPMLAVAVLAVLPTLALVAVLRRRTIAASQARYRASSGDLAGQANETLRNVRLVQAFGRHEEEAQRFDRASREVALSAVRSTAVTARLSPLADVVLAIGLAVVLILGTAQVSSHKLSLGAMFVFLAYLTALEEPVRSLSRLASTLGRGAASAERLAAILDQPLIHDDGRSGRTDTAATVAPAVSVENVTFAYEADAPVLSGLSFDVPAGGTACIVGPSGVGKSTLLGLFVRLHDPTTGRVVVGGTDVRERSWGSLHDEVALVPQDSWLVSGSIAENIAYGAPDATDEEIQRAGTIALVSEFVERLPAGWATEAGEGGVRLSGGQRRRVALARAIVGGSRLLLLDEPTAGLDVASKQAVIDAIRSVADGRTVLIVTHDPQLAAIADKVVTLRSPSEGGSGTTAETRSLALRR